MDSNHISVLYFAGLMEKQLLDNAHKGTWDNIDPLWLYAKLVEEVGELSRAIRDSSHIPSMIVHEAVDVANMAMMIADVFRVKYGSSER